MYWVILTIGLLLDGGQYVPLAAGQGYYQTKEECLKELVKFKLGWDQEKIPVFSACIREDQQKHILREYYDRYLNIKPYPGR